MNEPDETNESRPALNVVPGVIITLLAVTAMATASFWVWDDVPDRVPVHFGIDGRPDRYGSKWEALATVPIVALLVGLLMALVPLIDPRRQNLTTSGTFYYAVWIGVLAVISLTHAALIVAALGSPEWVAPVIIAAVAALMIVIGNFMGKTRSNFFLGFRTPWTLSSDYSWQRTHRIVGALYMAVGLATGVALAFGGLMVATIVLAAGILGATLLGVVLSYHFWRTDPERHSS
ncbi:MAG TPA: hypothetical protein DCL54_05835 [Alphaproteobacteria bacterium]|nr:hypothetical protein [Alphaproteobacteria bacterium]HAJ46083.1 hypothetical protein [Alphaproteobacteria bacterium]